MGLIRKSMAVGTLGVVNGSSKKQRVARAAMQSIEAANRLAERQAAEEHQFRYATDPVYKKYIDDKRAAAKAALKAQARHRAKTKELNRARRKQRWETAKGAFGGSTPAVSKLDGGEAKDRGAKGR